MRQPTYAEVGATRGVMPAGYQHLERTRTLGRGVDDFRRASDALMSWGAQRGAGLRVDATSEQAASGEIVTVRLGLGALAVKAPCVVVYTVHEARRRGFAYRHLARSSGVRRGAVPHRASRRRQRPAHHPRVLTSCAVVDSGPEPGSRLMQRAVTARYLRALNL